MTFSPVWLYPVASKNTEDTVVALSHYRGTDTIKLLYTDGAPEFARSCNTMQICHEISQPGISQNNGIIERTNPDVQIGTAACLLQDSVLDLGGTVLLHAHQCRLSTWCLKMVQSLW